MSNLHISKTTSFASKLLDDVISMKKFFAEMVFKYFRKQVSQIMNVVFSFHSTNLLVKITALTTTTAMTNREAMITATTTITSEKKLFLKNCF